MPTISFNSYDGAVGHVNMTFSDSSGEATYGRNSTSGSGYQDGVNRESIQENLTKSEVFDELA